MKSPIAKDTKKFVKSLKQYMKHRGLQIELTLKDGNKVMVDRERKIIKNEVVFKSDADQSLRIAINEIERAEIFVI